MTDPAEVVRIIIADDHPMFREGLRLVLSGADGFEVVGEAEDGHQAVALALEAQPDVAIMDLNMPRLLGVEATRQIVAASPHIGVLVLTMFDDDASVFAAMRAGARGYLLKGANRAAVLRAVSSVAQGDVIVGPAVARHLHRLLATRDPGTVFPELTRREHEVLARVAAGESNGEIARALTLSDKTVRNHISNLFTKLQVATRAQAIVRAREAGLGLTDDGPDAASPPVGRSGSA